jgi:hypothetical protein
VPSRPERLDELFLCAGVDKRGRVGEPSEQVPADLGITTDLDELRQILDLEDRSIGENRGVVGLEQR